MWIIVVVVVDEREYGEAVFCKVKTCDLDTKSNTLGVFFGKAVRINVLRNSVGHPFPAARCMI